jgi:hypothetical protein
MPCSHAGEVGRNSLGRAVAAIVASKGERKGDERARKGLRVDCAGAGGKRGEERADTLLLGVALCEHVVGY